MANLTPEQRNALDLLKEGDEYVRFFFRKAKGLGVFDALKQDGWFAPDKNPAPIQAENGGFRIPDWPAAEYLARAAVDTNNPGEHRYAEEMMQILRDVTKPADGKKRDNYRTWWRFTTILAALPLDVIKEEDAELISEWIDSAFGNTLVITEISSKFLPKLLDDGSERSLELAYRILEVVTRIHWKDKKGLDGNIHREAVFRVDPYWAKKLLQKNVKSLAIKCGIEVVTLLLERLKAVIKEDDHDRFSYIWRPAIEDHPQNKTQQLEIENILLTAIRESAVPLIDAHEYQVEGRKLVTELLDSDLQTFKRLAFYLVNESFFALQDIFYDKISTEWFEASFRHELYNLLSNRFNNFRPNERDRIVQIIDGLVVDHPEPEQRKRLTNHQRLVYLSAIHQKGHAAAGELYKKYSGDSDKELSHPDFPYYMHVGFAKHKSPFSADELLAMSPADLTNGLNTFESADWPSADEDGLARALSEAVKRNPERFTAALNGYVKLKPRFLAALLGAFQELCKTQPVDWSVLLNFTKQLIDHAGLWDRQEDEKAPGYLPKKRWVVSGIADLIRDGFTEGNHQIPHDLWDSAEAILATLLDREPGMSKANSDDALTEAINSSKGRALEALLVYTVERAQHIREKTGSHQQFWEQVQALFDKEIDKTAEGNFEFSALAGRWLPNLHFLSKEWVEKNIDRLFSTNSEPHWRHAVQGYSYVNNVYRGLYLLLRDHGDFKRVIDTMFDREKTRDKYLQHIVVAYLYGDEMLDEGSLFRYAIDKWRSEDLHEILWFMWTFRENPSDEVRTRAITLWQWFADRVRGQETENGELLADLCQLTSFLTTLGEKEKALLLQCGPFAGLKHHTSFLVEDLDRLADNNPNAVADIYLAILGNHIPDYPEEHIRSLVAKLYKAGLKVKANDICNKYRSEMYEFLKDAYNEFNRP